MTPTIITLEACWVRRITEVTTEIPSMAAINAAGAIIKGISLVNQISVCIILYLPMIIVMSGNFYKLFILCCISSRQPDMTHVTDFNAIGHITYLKCYNYLVYDQLCDNQFRGSEL